MIGIDEGLAVILFNIFWVSIVAWAAGKAARSIFEAYEKYTEVC